jgi:hypothetical protein
MAEYILDPELYTPKIESYTSDSEFDYKTRTQITNELPAIDIYEGLHSIMQNDLWKWFVGWTSTTFDVPFNIDTNGWEYFDDTGAVVEPSNAKYVNGIRVQNYGPQPENLPDGSIKIPTGTRYEVNGALLPDLDLLLHEGYRYLEKNYPDHPDWIELLTKNEIDDELVDAGQVIDYTPDVAIFDEIAMGLDYNPKTGGAELAEAKRREAFKLKLRNLTNNSWRRKLYGSKIGYQLFAAEALQNSNVYQVSRYLPYKGIKNPSKDASLNDPSLPTFDENGEFFKRNTEWFSEIFKDADFENRNINQFNRNYYRPFKLLDWFNSSYDYTYPSEAAILSTGYSVPFDPFGVYEFRYFSIDPDKLLPSKFAQYSVGQTININGEKKFVQGIYQLSGYEARFTKSDRFYLDDKALPGAVSKIGILDQLEPVYTQMYVYKSIEATLEELGPGWKYTDFVNDIANDNILRSFKDLYSQVENPKINNFTLNPVRNGSFLMPYDKLIMMYSNTINSHVERDVSGDNPRVVFDKDEISNDFSLKPKDFISQNIITDTSADFLAQVTKVTKGSAEFFMFKSPPLYPEEVNNIVVALNQGEEEIGTVIDLGTDEKIFVFGKPEFIMTDEPDSKGRWSIKNGKLNLTSIPKLKTRYMMQRLFPSYITLCNEKAKLLTQLFETGESFPKNNPYRVYYKIITPLTEISLEYEKIIQDLLDNIPADTKDERYAQLEAVYKTYRKAMPTISKKRWSEISHDTWKESRNPKYKDVFIAATTLFLKQVQDYTSLSVEDEVTTLCNSFDREYYSVIPPNATDYIKEVYERIWNIDKRINVWIANRWYMLSPDVKEPWIENQDLPNSVLKLEELKTYVHGFYRFSLSPIFGDEIDFTIIPELGTEAVINDYISGYVNTILIADNGILKTEYLGTDGVSLIIPKVDIYTKQPVSFIYPISEYYDTNPLIQEMMNEFHTRAPGLCYTEGSFLERLSMVDFNNISGLTKKFYEIKIRGTINVEENPYLINIVDDESLKRMATVNVGDEIMVDAFVQENTLVEEVNTDKKYIRGTIPFTMSGDWIVKYRCVMNVAPDQFDDDFFRYRYLLEKNSLLDKGNAFTHGLYGSDTWPDKTSGAKFNSPIDSKYFKETLINDIQSNSRRKNSFNEIIMKSYQTDKSQYVLPSMIFEQGDLFFEMQPIRVLNGQLSSVTLLDYFADNMKSLARGGDFINVGVNLTMQTDNSGNWTAFPNKKVTDASIMNRFRTVSWSEATLPMYLEVGTGELPKLFDPKPVNDGSINEVDFSVPRFYYEGDEKERAGERVERGSVYGALEDDGWTGDGIYAGEDVQLPEQDYSLASIKHIAEPLFETPLGEYEVKRFVNPEGISDNTSYTLITSTIIRQELNDLKKTGTISVNFDKVFKISVLENLGAGTYEDKTKKPSIKLVSLNYPSQYDDKILKTDVSLLQFDGEYNPVFIYNDEIGPLDNLGNPTGGYEIQWPKDPLPNFKTHYMIITKDVVLPNVYNKYDGYSSVKNIGFSKMTALIFENGKWTEKGFILGGIYGNTDALNLSLTPLYEGFEIQDVDLGLTYSPGKVVFDKKPDAAATDGSWTLKHRLLTKLLGQLGKFKGNLDLARTFSVEDLTEMARWFDASLDDSNVAQWTLQNYGVSYNTIEALITAKIKGTSLKTLPVDFISDEFSLDNIFWFILGPIEKEKDNWSSLSLIGFKEGDGLALIYSKEKNEFYIYSFLSMSKWAYLVDTTHLSGMSNAEWLTFCGLNGYSVANDKYWIPAQKKNNLFTEIIFPRTRLSQGTVDVSFRIDPNFTTSGWKWEDYLYGKNLNNKIIDIKVSENPLYVDEDKKAIYTYNGNDKYVLKMKENRFFKNVLFVIGNYQLQEVEIAGTINKIPRISLIPGVSFDIDDVTTLDRLLRIENIKIRSSYSRDLESVQSSSYAKINGYLKGIYIDPNVDFDKLPNSFIEIGFKGARGPAGISNKIEFSNEIQKLTPIRNINGATQSISNTDVDFNNITWPGSEKFIQKPLITYFDFRRELSQENKNLTFTYFRNTLILEGTLDTAQPNVINFSNNERLGDAIDNILTGDKVLKIASLDYSKYDGVGEYTWNPISYWTKDINGVITHQDVTSAALDSIDIVKVDFAEGFFIAASNDGKVAVYETDSLLELPKIINCDLYNFAIETGTTLTGIRWNTKEKLWYFSYSSQNGTSKIISFSPNTHTFEEALVNPGIDVNTYQLIQVVDVDGQPNNESTTPDTSLYTYIYARDMAYTEIELNTQTPVSLVNSWKEFTKIIDAATNKDAITIKGPLDATKASTNQIQVNSKSYSELEFQVYQTSGNGNITLGINDQNALNTDPNAPTPVKGYRYDRSISKWIEITTDKVNKIVPIISGFNGNLTGFKTYIVGKEFAESGLEILPAAALPPRAPDGIPKIEYEGLEIFDELESGDYPPPRVPYSARDLIVAPNHPLFAYIQKLADSQAVPLNPLLKDAFYFIALEDYNDNTKKYIKGQVYVLDLFYKNKIKVFELAWWCATNDLAPMDNQLDEYGNKIFVNIPGVSPNLELIYEVATKNKEIIGSDGVNITDRYTGSDKENAYLNLDIDNDSFYTNKKSIARDPLNTNLYEKMIIPLEFQNQYLDENDNPSAHRFFTEYLIFTRQYQEYVNNYNSYIAGNDFKNYINLLKKSWKYAGVQEATIKVMNFIGNGKQVEGALGQGFDALQSVKETPHFLTKLPPPQSSGDIGVSAIVINNDTKYNLSVKVDGTAEFRLINPTLTPAQTVKENFSSSLVDSLVRTRKEGTYNPYRTPEGSSVPLSATQRSNLMANKYTAWNSLGYQTIIIGDSIFIYSPTRKFDVKKSANNTQYILGKTSQFHWKKATLPNRQHIEWNLLRQMSLKDAQDYAYQVRYQFLVLLDNLIDGGPSAESLAAINAVKTWIIDNPIEGISNGNNISPNVYETDDQIPTVIKLLGITFIETENGPVPSFSQDSEFTFISTGNDGTGLLNKDNYYQYLNYYLTYIIGHSRFSNYFSDGIKQVFMSNQYIGILTKNDDLLTLPLEKTAGRDQIEDPNNWNISNIDPQYVISSISNTTTEKKTIIADGKIYTFGMWPTEKNLKGFKISSILCQDNAILIAGYVQANEIIQKMATELTSYSIIHELYPNDSWQHFPDKKYPVIFYSDTGGKSFKKAKLPPIEFIPNIKSYNGNTINPDGSIIPESTNSNMDAFSIHRHGNEFHIWFRNLDVTDVPDPSGSYDSAGNIIMLDYRPLGYTTFEINDTGRSLELNWLENVTLVEKKTQSQLAMLAQLDDNNANVTIADYNELKPPKEGEGSYNYDDLMELKLLRTQSSTFGDRAILTPIGNTTIIIQQPFLYQGNNIEVVKIQDETIYVTPPDVTAPNYKSETIRVLLSIVSNKMISDQAKYIEPKEVYLNWKGNFIVPEFIEVEDISQANRMYSYRECLKVFDPSFDYAGGKAERDALPKQGIPSVLEDVNHKIYQYYDSYTNINNEEIFDYKPATNKDGAYVMLCNQDGNYLIEKDSWKNVNFLRLFQMCQLGIPSQSLVKAPIIVEGYDITVPDYKITALLNGGKYEWKENDIIYIIDEPKYNRQERIRYFDMQQNAPRTLIESVYIDDIINFMADKSTIGGDMFYSWPLYLNDNGTIKQPPTPMPAPDNDPKLTGEDAGVWNDYWEYTHRVQDAEGYFNSAYNTTDRKGRITYKQIGENWVVFDSELSLIPSKYADKVIMNINLAYTSKAGIQQYNQSLFAFNDDGKLQSPNPDFPITGIYLNPKGYGGSNNNISWQEEQPWEIDQEAFKNEIILNENGDNIYLADEKGEYYTSLNGLTYFEFYETIDINEQDLYEKNHVVKTWLKGHEAEESLDYYIYKRESSDLLIWSPKDTLYFNNDSKTSGVVYLYKNGMIPIGFSANGFEANDITGKKLFTYYFTDYEDNKRDDVQLITQGNLYYIKLNDIHEPFINDILKLTVSSSYKTYIKTFKVVMPEVETKEVGKVQTINEITYTENNEFMSDSSSIIIEFDLASLEVGDQIASDDSSILIVQGNFVDEKIPLSNGQYKPWKVVLNVDRKPDVLNLQVIRNSVQGIHIENLQLNIQTAKDISLLSVKDWYIDENDKALVLQSTKIYAQDVDITNKFNIVFDEDIIKASYGGIDIRKQLYKKENVPYNFIFNEFVFNRGVSTVLDYPEVLLAGDEKPPILISGLKTKVLMKKPIYQNFKSLLDIKKQTILINQEPINKYDGELFNEINTIDERLQYVDLKYPLPKEELNDGLSHEVQLKVLTTASQQLKTTVMNNPDYIEEVSIVEIDKFGYDRIYFDPEGYPQSPVKINGTYYNLDNESMFETEKNIFRNRNGLKIFQCDEHGNYIYWILENGLPVAKKLGEPNGDLSKVIYGAVDKRYNPRNPIFDSTYEWFVKQFYVKGQETNPFWQTIRIKDFYNSTLKKWTQKIQTTRSEKSIDIIRDVDVQEIDLYSQVENGVNYEIFPDKISSSIQDYIDYANGKLNCIFKHPNINYYNNKSFIKYGIYANNSFYQSGSHKNVWKDTEKVDILSTYNYAVNTLENKANLEDRNQAIVKVKEMGIFDENHNLVAYATFPPVEYRSDSQHLSFSLVIRNKMFPVQVPYEEAN